jgi:hypothetical protein
MKKQITKQYAARVFSLILVAASFSFAQQSSYSDVLVVINSASAASEEIGSYFAAQRNIPAVNIVRITAPVSEEITDV